VPARQGRQGRRRVRTLQVPGGCTVGSVVTALGTSPPVQRSVARACERIVSRKTRNVPNNEIRRKPIA